MLAELSRKRLFELVMQFAARAEPEAQIGRPPKTPDNPSVPPPAGFKPKRAERR